jgi:hypothetical protein
VATLDSSKKENVMRRIKDMSRGGWIVIGIVVALLIVPSGVAAAKALGFTGIEGTSGNKVDVTAAAQLQVADAAPSNLYSSPLAAVSGAAGTPPEVVVAGPLSNGLIINEITLSVIADPNPGMNDYVQVYTATASPTCLPDFRYDNLVTPATLGLTSISIPSGLAIPAGDELCAAGGGSVEAWVEATGYEVPATAIPAMDARRHSSTALPRQ